MTNINTDAPQSNYRRLVAGGTLSASDLVADWRRVIRITPPDGDGSAEPAVIELPPVRSWPKPDLVIVDSTGAGFTLIPSDNDQIVGDVGERGTLAGGHGVARFRYSRSTARLLSLVSGHHDEPDAWVVTT